MVCLLPGIGLAEPGGDDTERVPVDAEQLFAGRVLPLLQQKCFGCHGDAPDDIKGGFDIRSRRGLLEGGDSEEPAVVPGRPADSVLWLAVQGNGLMMPPKESDRLNAEQVEILRSWISAGAPWPGPSRLAELRLQAAADDTEAAGLLVSTSGGLTAEWNGRRYDRRDLWALRARQRVAVPWHALSEGAAGHPIDAFLADRLNARGLRAAGPASKRHLLQRATWGLTGLPPTPQQLAAFLRDESPAAFDNVLTRLLSSPRYGEHWARHWLDVVRYADTGGYANDYERPHVWRYRDYVIRSLNQDKPYDRFVLEQIAGDELDAPNPDCLIATGFLRLGPWEHTGMAVEAVTRQLFLDDVTNAVGQTFLGINMTCFRCHDHKFDPFPARDYYRMQAVFAPTQFGDRKLPFQADENTSSFAAGTLRVERLLAAAETFRARIKRKNERAVAALLEQHGVTSRQQLPETIGNVAFYGLTDLEKSLQKINNKRIAYYRRELARFQPFAFSVYNGPFLGYRGIQNKPTLPLPHEDQRRGEVQTVHLLEGGALQRPGPRVSPGVLSAVPVSDSTRQPNAGHGISTEMQGRRLALARWIASARHPLTARVVVNRVWQQHFGRGLVATPNAFGKMGSKPTHPRLLDWLASWFVDHGWSLKRLHQLIMTSQAYQRACQHDEIAGVRRIDPDNELLAVFTPRRLAAEELRDGLLAICEELNYEMGGPGVYPEINWAVALQPRQIMGTVAPAYQPSRTPQQRNRRTIFAFRYRTLPDPMLEVFNRPQTEFSCGRRDETTVTPQVFALFNGQFVHDRALSLANRLMHAHQDPRQRIELAFRRVHGRSASDSELLISLRHVQEMTRHHRQHAAGPRHVPTSVKRGMVEELTGKLYQFDDQLTLMRDYVQDLKPWQVSPETRALAELCLVLMNSNEFIYVY